MHERLYAQTQAVPPRIYEYVLAGLLLTAAAAVAIGYHVYHGWVTLEIARDRAYWGIGLPFVGVTAGVFLFAYGWQRGDPAKAARMAMWLTLGAAGIIAAILAAFAFRGAARSGGRSFLRFGLLRRRRRSGWHFGDTDGAYEYGWFGGDIGPGEDEGRPPPATLEVHCRNCGDIFTPAPPRILCPSCGTSALGNSA